MKRTLLILVAITVVILSCAIAESAAYENSCFSIVLPEGVAPVENSNAYVAAAEADYGTAVETLLVASDPAQINLVAVTAIDSADTAANAAAKAAEILLGSSDTVTGKVAGTQEFSVFTCSIDAVKYSFYYISNGTRVFCITCASFAPEDEEALIASFKFL